MGLKLCKDCKHFENGQSAPASFCARKAKMSDPDLVYGHTYMVGHLYAYDERNRGECGKEALFWEAK